MSKIANELYDILTDMFPRRLGPRVKREIFVRHAGHKLFFDFYIKELGIYIEVQGRQHTEFVEHFHNDKETFMKQKQRDNAKIEYVQETGKCLIRFHYNEEITEDLVREKIDKVLDGECFYE
jgi:hypothetical protein